MGVCNTKTCLATGVSIYRRMQDKLFKTYSRSSTVCMLWVFNVCENHHLDKQVLKASKALHEGNGHVHFKTHLDEQSLDRLKHC